MEKVWKLKKSTKAICCFVLAMILCLTHFSFLGYSPRISASAEEDDIPEYTGIYANSMLTVSNPQFADVSGSFPKTASSWTAGYINDNKGDVISGVIDLTAASYATNTDKYKLDKYPEYSGNKIPQTPFGRKSGDNSHFDHYESTNTSVLMINTVGSSTAYGYTSSSIALSANSHYKISAWVKTGNFTGYQNSGATIKMTGIEDEDIAFRNINTVEGMEKDADGNPILTLNNNFGWQEFTFFIATGYKSQSVTLHLQLGDETDEIYYPTKGYAFFDNISAYQISPEFFEDEKNFSSGNKQVVNLSDAGYITKNDANGNPILNQQNEPTEIGNFRNGLDGWEVIMDEGTGGAITEIYNARAIFSDDNYYNFKTNHAAPNGVQDSGNNIFVLSSYLGNQYRRVAAGIRSSHMLIKRNQYYRLGYWVKTQDIEGGSGATAAVVGKKAEYNTDLEVTQTNITGNDDNKHRYGWQNYAFFIKGSALQDSVVQLELWLGQEDSLSKGIAMYDDITLQVITEEAYTEESTGSYAKEVILDGDIESSMIPNGDFHYAGSYDEYAYPLPPSGWTFYDTATVGTEGYSDNLIKTEKSVSGIIPTDNAHFNANRMHYLGATNPMENEVIQKNVLFMASTDPTAFCYRSSDYNAAALANVKLFATLRTDSIRGAGASLVLKRNNRVISSVQNIDTQGEFQTYSFYIEGGASDTTLTLEIWLGMNDTLHNKSKLSSGYVFVTEVNVSTLEDTFAFDDETFRKYRGSQRDNIISLGINYFDNYDRYTNHFVKAPVDWNLSAGNHADAKLDHVTYGIFDYHEIRSSGQFEIPSTFHPGDSLNRNILYLHNRIPTASKLTYPTHYVLTENSYYQISVKMKVDIPKQRYPSNENENTNAVGAGIALTNTDFSFKNIKDRRTTEVIDGQEVLMENAFQTYTFYVRTKEAESASVSFEFSLGGSKNYLEFTSGRLYVSDIDIQELQSDAFEESVKDIEDDDAYNIKADLRSDDDTTPEDPELPEEPAPGEPSWFSQNWYVIPSAIFGLALLIAIVAIGVRRFLQRRPNKQRKEKKAGYDRKMTLEQDNYGLEEKTESLERPGASFDDFDEDSSSKQIDPIKEKPSKSKPEPKVKPEEPKTEADETEAGTDQPEENQENYVDDFED